MSLFRTTPSHPLDTVGMQQSPAVLTHTPNYEIMLTMSNAGADSAVTPQGRRQRQLGQQ